MSQNMSRPRTPEEYQEELMQLYRAAKAAAPTTAEPVIPPKPEPSVPTEPMPQPEPPVPTEPTPQPQPSVPIEPTPQPEPAVPTEPMPAPEMEQAFPKAALEKSPEQVEQPAVGWIQVITRSAGNARALPGVSVLITNGTDAQMKLEHVAVTDESGETEKIPLPVPAASLSLDENETRQPYSTYDVSVYASGFYRQVSEKVPVFAGTTSRQIFSMIPLPVDIQETPEPMVFQNTEPNLS